MGSFSDIFIIKEPPGEFFDIFRHWTGDLPSQRDPQELLQQPPHKLQFHTLELLLHSEQYD